jgi:hypothetical protein
MSALVSTAIGLCLHAPGSALAASPTATNVEAPPAAPLHRRNAVVGTAAFPIPDYGIGLSYMRALGRRYSVSAGLDYAAPRKGYGHLVGLSQTLGAQIWITRPLHGVWAGGSLTLSETFLAKASMLRRVAVAAGVNAGFLWQFRFGLLLGASGSLRFAKSAGGTELVCTREGSCPATRSGIYARLGVDVGWAF